MRSLRQITLYFFILLLAGAKAQQLRFRHITSEDGLSTVFVRSITQDEKGFMWFGTQDGLNKYDGFRFRVFKPDPTNPNSLPGSDITAIKQVRPNLILVGTANGLGFFNPVNETCLRPEKPGKEAKAQVNAIYGLDESSALIGTPEGLFVVSLYDRTLNLFSTKEKLDVLCIEKINGVIYVGTSGSGLWKLNGNSRLEKVSLAGKPGLSAAAGNTITCISSKGDNIFLGTFGYGILQCDPSFRVTDNFTFGSFQENTDYIRAISATGDKVYAATGYGLVVYEQSSRHTAFYAKQDNSHSLNANGCTSLFTDAVGNCWVGTELGGVNVAFARGLRFPVSNAGYENRLANVFSFHETGKGTILVGGVKTFSEIDPATSSVISHAAFLGDGTALCIEKESENIYWVGTWGNGIYRYNLATGKTESFLSRELGGTIVCLKKAGDHMYAGSVGDGLFRINITTGEVQRFTEKEGLPFPSVNCIYEDKDRKVWIGTYDGGLAKLGGYDANGKLPVEKLYKNNGQPGDIASNVIFAVNEDSKGHLWVATAGGLSRLMDHGKFQNYYEKDGLPSSFLYSLLPDSAGNFWMSTNSGIVRFNPLSPLDNITFKTYSVKDGLVNTEYSMGAAFKTSNGTMLFGGGNGFNAFRPEWIRDNPNAPKSYVSGYKRGGRDVATDSLMTYKQHLNLDWRENYLQFELVALDYTDPASNKFSYMLEGYDADWSEPGTVRYVSYTELPGGEYTFKVKAANNDGTWNDTPYEVKITVVPPFWKTKAFYILVLVLGIGAVVGFTQYRTRAIKKENKVLEAKVTERTKELHEKNLDITSSIEYAKRIQEAILPSKEHIFSRLKKAFIIYRPKDIVSGDFYWFAEKNGTTILAVVDCTGHGVPGAFMSMIGHNLLNQIVLENAITDPGDILNHLHRGIQAALRQGHNEISTNDGMDVSLITLGAGGAVKWAGANRPLILIGPNQPFERLEGDKFPVGGAQAYIDRVFTTKPVNAPPGTMAYMFSDGYADQFGGEKGKKFMVKKLHELLGVIYTIDPAEQKSRLEESFLSWMGSHEQVDDVLVAGLEI